MHIVLKFFSVNFTLILEPYDFFVIIFLKHFCCFKTLFSYYSIFLLKI